MAKELNDYQKMCLALIAQRRRLLENSGRFWVGCIACGKSFWIFDTTEQVLYCCEEHQHHHRQACKGGTFSMMDFAIDERSCDFAGFVEKVITGKE